MFSKIYFYKTKGPYLHTQIKEMEILKHLKLD
jgi:hypothetical protein